MSDSHVYVRNEQHYWVPARVVEKKGNHVTVSIPQYQNEQSILSDGGKGAKKYTREVIDLSNYNNQVLPLQNVDEMGWLNEENDMVNLPFLHEAAILYNLKSRHVKGKPYTRTGDIVIAVNPYEWFNHLYTSEQQKLYAQKLVWETTKDDARNTLQPHVYETSALAYKGLALEGFNQSILVSGESGAGKTETVKICMNHIAMVQGCPIGKKTHAKTTTSPIVQRVVESNPLLEAFGNAKTRRNDNSSRFGKYLQLQFQVGETNTLGDRSLKDCKLAGSKCEVYLLEKSRVVTHDDEERSFHIFYQLLSSPDNVKGKFWNKLSGKTASSFNYIGKNNTKKIEGMTDAQHFNNTLRALELVGIHGDKLTVLMKAIAAVLQLGNIGFTGCADKSRVSTLSELDDLAELIGVSTATLCKAFTQRTMDTGNERVMVDLNAETAKESCDALAKAIYHEAFLWLVREINNSTEAAKNNNNQEYNGEYGIIGLLDIFGFEHFEKNGFEQLCINYANEKLQHKFTEDIFKQVQAEYEYEGLALEDIRYDDNHHVLDLIESRMGLLAMLNEECVRPGGSDREFVYKAIRENKSSTALIVDKKHSPYEFGIGHYAGDVLYTAESFIIKNNDTLPGDLKQCAGMSTNSIIAGVLQALKTEKNKKTFRRTGSNSLAGTTVWSKYKGGLTKLMDDLQRTNSRYIRCIKPNEMKLPSVMQHGPTLEQLRSAGVISAVTITRSAFPNRMDHENVIDRFRHLAKRRKTTKYADYAAAVEKILKPLLKHMETSSGDRKIKAYAVGKTRTYFRAGALEYLEAKRIENFEPNAILIQKITRGFLVRKYHNTVCIERREAATKIQKVARIMLAKVFVQRQKTAKELYKLHNSSATLINKIARGAIQRKKFQKDLKKYREVTAMKNELAELQRRVEESERKKVQAVKDAEERTKRAMKALKESRAKPQNHSADAGATLKLLEDRNRMVEKMRDDNKRIRANIKLLETKHKRLRDETKRLKEENERETKKLLELNEEAKAMSEENNKAMENQNIWKRQITSLADELKTAQQSFIESSETRGRYETTIAEIIKTVRQKSRDEQLVEDIIFIALDTDTEAKALKACFDAVQAHKADKKTDDKCDKSCDATDNTEDSTSMADDDFSLGSFDESELDREAAEMEAELEALSAEMAL